MLGPPLYDECIRDEIVPDRSLIRDVSEPTSLPASRCVELIEPNGSITDAGVTLNVLFSPPTAGPVHAISVHCIQYSHQCMRGSQHRLLLV